MKLELEFKKFKKHSRLVTFSIFFFIFFSVLMIHNYQLFTTAIFENSDFAANSILINLAKKFQLYVGNYSRMHFNHPGPAFLYIQAIFEIVLFDLFHFVPTPFNAHIISIIILNSLLLAISCCILLSLSKSFIRFLPVIALLLFYFSINPVFISSTWMPFAYFVPFLTFILSASSIASKRPFFIWSMILTGGLLIHGHVSFILITVPVMAISLLLCLSHHKYDINAFIKENRLNILVTLSLIFLFALPIVINTIINYPGEFGKYYQYSSNRIQQTPDIKSIFIFFLPFWSIGNIWSINTLGGIIFLSFSTVVMTTIFYFITDYETKLFIKNFMIISIITSLTFLLYVSKGIDHLTQENHYTGLFFYAIPLTFLIIILICLTNLVPNNKLILISTIITIIFLASSGNFKNTEEGSPYIKDIIFKLQSDPRWNDKIVLDFPHDSWPEVTALVIALERHGKQAYLSNPFWEFMFTKQHILTNKDKDTLKEWHINIGILPGNFSNVIFSNSQIILIDENTPESWYLETNWYDLENWNGISTRWIKNNATIKYYSEGRIINMKLNVTSFYKPRYLQIFLNDKMISQYNVYNGPIMTIEIKKEFKNGFNDIRFFSPECQKPIEIFGSKDERCLSLAIQDIKLY